jgi:hypothetical protein
MVEILIINLYVRRVRTICNSALVMGQTEGKCTDFTDHESSTAQNSPHLNKTKYINMINPKRD